MRGIATPVPEEKHSPPGWAGNVQAATLGVGIVRPTTPLVAVRDITPDQEAVEVQAQKWAEETLATFGITPEDTAADIAAGREEAAITALLEKEFSWVCGALDMDAVDLPAEWTRHHPGITATKVAELIKAGEIDPRTATC